MGGEFHNWKNFCDALRLTYGQQFEEHTLRNQLEALKQTGSVDAYARRFRQLVTLSLAVLWQSWIRSELSLKA